MRQSNPNPSPDSHSESAGWTGSDHVQLSEIVAMRLREDIISGRLKKGQFLRIDAVAKSMGVSMTPVREGLLLLQSESYVQLLPRRGFVVNSFSKSDLLDLFWVQATIGAELASRATMKMPMETIERLEKEQHEYEIAVAAGDDRLVPHLGHDFHRAINLAAESPRLALLLGNLTKQLPNRFYASIEGNLSDTVRYHPVILEAIKRRDAKTASSLMFRHISAAGEHLVSMLERQGIWSSEPSSKQSTPSAQTAEGTARQRRQQRRPRAKASSSRER